MRLLYDRILIKPEQVEKITNAGIFIPDVAQKKPKKGIVVECGPGKDGYPISVEKGDLVYYEETAGIPMTIDGEKFLLLTENDIQAIV